MGRPRKYDTPEKPRTPNTKVKPDSTETITYRCTRCGKTRQDPKNYFYMSKASPIFTANEMYSCICVECANELFEQAKIKYKDEKIAMIIICHYLDIYFDESSYEQIKSNANFSFGIYSRTLNANAYKKKNFTTCLVEIIKNGLKGSKQIQVEKEVTWNKEDRNNKSRVLRLVKYDPFENANDESRKFMFNLCNNYLQDEAMIEDPHILQGVIEIVISYNQIRILDNIINEETTSNAIDETRLKSLTESKIKILSSVNQFAKDNGISASTNNKGQKGTGSLAYYTRLFDDIHFTDAEMNLFDIQTCEAMKQFADISNASILDQIRLRGDELGEMTESQTKTVLDLREKVASLEEELRKLKLYKKIIDSGEYTTVDDETDELGETDANINSQN